MVKRKTTSVMRERERAKASSKRPTIVWLEKKTKAWSERERLSVVEVENGVESLKK